MMITHSSVSILNAIPLGIGSVQPINLKFITKIENGSGSLSQDLKILSLISKENIGNIKVLKKSEIPPGVGLKSSSAYTTSLIGAYAEFKKIKMEKIEIARLSSIVSKQIGISITGAFDDSIGSLIDAIPVTDNKKREILEIHRPFDLPVIITIPNLKRPNNVKDLLISRKKDFLKALEHLKKGEIVECANINGVAVGRSLGYPVEPILNARKIGALITGYTGNGPAFFSIAEKESEHEVMEYMQKFGRTFIVEVYRND